MITSFIKTIDLMKHPFILLSALFVCISCTQEATTETASTTIAAISDNRLTLADEQLKNIAIDTVALQKKAISGALTLTGKVDVDPDKRVSLSSALGGRISTINALPGKTVKKGEVIVELEDNQFIQLQQDYLATKARLRSAAADYHRQKELNASQSTSDRAAELAETEYQSLLAAESALEEKLRLINIDPTTLTPEHIKRSIQLVAPFNGVVSEVLVNKGKYVSPSDVLVELIDPEGLLLSIKVFERDWPKISIGQHIEAFTNGAPDQKIQASIIATGNAINNDGSTNVIARVMNTNGVKLVAGLYVNAVLNLDEIETYVLPEDAVVSHEGAHYIFESIDRNTFQLTAVTTNEPRNGIMPIANPEVLQGKTIVGTGAYALLMALKNTAEE